MTASTFPRMLKQPSRRSWVLFAAVVLFVLAGAAAHPAVAESFEDRWSIIPKANAAPLPPTTQQPIEPAAETASQAINPRYAKKRMFAGKASFYSYTRGKTASGAKYNRNAMTAAHRHLPFGTRLRVTDIATKKAVIVVVTDRGPFIGNRILDLSLGAARTLGITQRGIANVRVEIL